MPTWTDDIVSALQTLGGTATYDEIYTEVAKLRPTLPESWRDTIRREIQRQSADSNGYENRRDLFFSVEGLGRGIWGLRQLVNETPVALDLPSGDERPERVAVTTYRVLRDTKLARQVKLLHRDRCQLCGVALGIPGGATYSEAHHIIPLGQDHNGPDVPANIIVLCPNHHALCDMGAIPLLRGELRRAPGHDISEESLKYHNERILWSVNARA